MTTPRTGVPRRSVLLAALLVLSSAVALAGASTAEPSFPGANGKLAFTSLDGAIYVTDASGGSPRDITAPSFYDSNPAWSPDGSRLAYAGIRDGNFEILVMDANGGSERRLTRDPAADWNPTWSPDGLRIAFASS
jgi:TolB protein